MAFKCFRVHVYKGYGQIVCSDVGPLDGEHTVETTVMVMTLTVLVTVTLAVSLSIVSIILTVLLRILIVILIVIPRVWLMLVVKLVVVMSITITLLFVSGLVVKVLIISTVRQRQEDIVIVFIVFPILTRLVISSAVGFSPLVVPDWFTEVVPWLPWSMLLWVSSALAWFLLTILHRSWIYRGRDSSYAGKTGLNIVF